ncbi:MAG: hypothetical protein WC783_00780 [Candidatus Paceibacterota bacterium]|jgi:hypothetical protein
MKRFYSLGDSQVLDLNEVAAVIKNMITDEHGNNIENGSKIILKSGAIIISDRTVKAITKNLKFFNKTP